MAEREKETDKCIPKCRKKYKKKTKMYCRVVIVLFTIQTSLVMYLLWEIQRDDTCNLSHWLLCY